MGTHTHLRPPPSQVLSVSAPSSRGITAAAPASMGPYSHDNRVKYVVRYLYDIDNNGVLDKNDFKCLAVRNTIVETKGDFPIERFNVNVKVMENLWNEIDINGDGLIGVDEYRLDVITRMAFVDIKEIDDAYNKLASDADKAAGGIGLKRYCELYGQFIGSKDEGPFMYLFGPIKEL